MLLVVPTLDATPYPSLGARLCDWIERNCVHGPGDLLGERPILDNEKRGLIYRAYEVFPRHHEQEGRRRFKRVALSVRKGWAKTELAAWIAAAELAPDAPVRCVGWEGDTPIGGPVRDPYIPMVAYTQEQSEELAYGTLLAIVRRGPLRDRLDAGEERIIRLDGSGKCVALANAPNARDGARTTFQHFDETGRFVLTHLKKAHATMLANVPKRYLADAWSLETTTAPTPGEASVAESTYDYARAVADGFVSDSRLFFFHRQASESHDTETPKGLRAAILEASGPIVAKWSDLEGIAAQWNDPTADRAYLRRVWLNQLVRSSEQAFDSTRWRQLADKERFGATKAADPLAPGKPPPDGELITLGFDGARVDDATGIVGTHVESGYQWVVGAWQRAPGLPDDARWEVPADQVAVAVDQAMDRWQVWRLYADPPYWETTVAEWAGKYGSEKVLEWWTNRLRPMAYSLRSYSNAIAAGDLCHSGDTRMAAHVGNAQKRLLALRDEQGERLWVIQKDRPDSPRKIDLAMAGCLSWEARQDAIAAGALKKKRRSAYAIDGAEGASVARGLLVV